MSQDRDLEETKLLTAPGDTELTLTGARSTARPLTRLSIAPDTPAMIGQSTGGLMDATPAIRSEQR